MPTSSAIDSPPSPVEHRVSKPPRAARSRYVKWGLLLLGALVLAGAILWLHGRNRQSTDDAEVDGHLAPISAKITGSDRMALLT